MRSSDKLTGEGVTFIGTDLVNIIEEILPAKFGGASTDYQILKEEDEQGHTRLSIIVDPKLGAIDEVELITTVLHELGKGVVPEEDDSNLVSSKNSSSKAYATVYHSSRQAATSSHP